MKKERKISVGTRIDIFKVESQITSGFWNHNGWYAEAKDGEYDDNRHGRNMISEPHDFPFRPHQNIINELNDSGMRKVGTMVITKLK